MNQPLIKTVVLPSLATLALLTQSCSHDDMRKELRQANDELRQENKELREKVATIDKQLAQLIGRFEELQRDREAGNQKAIGRQIEAQEETRKRSEVDTRLRTDQLTQQNVTTVKKIAAQMDRLLAEMPSVENSLAAWDVTMPKVAAAYKNASLQMNSLVAELDGLKFERSDEVKLKITGFSNGYQSLPGIGRMAVSSRERAATLRATANPSQSDLDAAAGEEVAMTGQLAVFNATIAECKKLQTELAQWAN